MLPGRLGLRFALEALFLVLLAVGAGLADLRPLVIVLVMAVAWVLVALVEFTAERIASAPLAYLLPRRERSRRRTRPSGSAWPLPEERTVVAPPEQRLPSRSPSPSRSRSPSPSRNRSRPRRSPSRKPEPLPEHRAGTRAGAARSRRSGRGRGDAHARSQLRPRTKPVAPQRRTPSRKRSIHRVSPAAVAPPPPGAGAGARAEPHRRSREAAAAALGARDEPRRRGGRGAVRRAR